MNGYHAKHPCPDKVVLNKTTHCNGEFISSVFTRLKKDGSHRLILNLKNLNEFVTYQHFKMESLQSAAQLLKKDYWMAVLDLKDAYYSVPINLQHRKYLRFEFNGTLYEFNCLPNGLASAPRVFTKLMKPVYATLRSKGYLIVGYIDDILLLAETPEQLAQVVADTVSLLRALGFTIHDTKSMILNLFCPRKQNNSHTCVPILANPGVVPTPPTVDKSPPITGFRSQAIQNRSK